MIFGVWWGAWLLGFALVIAAVRMIYCFIQATKPLTEEERKAEAEAWRKSWDAYGPKNLD